MPAINTINLFNSLSYNGIFLQIVKTEEFSQKPIYTKDRVEYLYTECTGLFTCVYNPYSTSYIAGDPQPVQMYGSLPSATNTAVRAALLQKRKTLIFNLDFSSLDNTIINSPGPDSVADVNEGPEPIHCTVWRMDGDKTFHVRFGIKTWIIECVNPGKAALISSRWSQSVDIDSNFYSSRRTEGIAYFRADIIENTDYDIDQYRSRLIPDIPLGYKRETSNYAVDSQRNIMTWMIVDREMPRDIGATGTDGGNGTYVSYVDGEYKLETMPTSGVEHTTVPGPMSLATFSCTVYGSKLSNAWVLTLYAFAIANNKLPILSSGDPSVGFLRSIRIAQGIMNKTVSLSISMSLTPNPETSVFGFLPVKGLLIDDVFYENNFKGDNPSPPGDSGSRGSSLLLIVAAAIRGNNDDGDDSCQTPLKPPCSQDYGIYASGMYSACDNKVPVQTFNYIPPTLPPQLSPGDNVTPLGQAVNYTRYDVTSKYVQEFYTAQMPIAAPPANNPGAEIVTLAAPTSKRIVKFFIERVNALPAPPNPELTDQNYTLAKTEIAPYSWDLLPDGQSLVYTVQGEYTYFATNPVGAGGSTPINFDAPPWIAYQNGSQLVPGGNPGYTQQMYQSGIIDSKNNQQV